MYWLIIGFVLFVIITMPLKIRIIRNDEKSDIDLYLTKIFNIRVDIDEAIKYLLSTKDNRKVITVESALYKIMIMYKLRKFYSDIMKRTKITKTTVIPKLKRDEEYYKTVFLWIFLSFTKKLLNDNFGYIDNEVYNVHVNQENTEMNFEIVFRIRIITIIISFIKNLKTINHIRKITKKGSENYE